MASAERSRSRSRSPRRGLVGASSSEPASAAALVAEATEHLEAFPPRPEQARELFDRAVELAPENPEILDAAGVFWAEDGEQERAQKFLNRSLELRPDAGVEKFLYLAQMVSGEASLSYYEKGARVIDAAIAAAANGTADQAAVLRRKLASVRVAVAELYMTDLCDLPDAEQRCEAALDLGLEADAASLPVLATKATLRKVQGRIEDCKALALQCASAIKGSDKDEEEEETAERPASSGNGTSTSSGAAASSGETLLLRRPTGEAVDEVSDEVIVAVVEALIEVEETTEARDLLLMLLERDEEDVQVWYLLGLSHVMDKEIDEVRECCKYGLRYCGKHAPEYKTRFRDLLKQAKLIEGGAEGDTDEVGPPAAEAERQGDPPITK